MGRGILRCVEAVQGAQSSCPCPHSAILSTKRTRIMPNASDYFPVELSIVVPTFNERDNVEKLIEHLA